MKMEVKQEVIISRSLAAKILDLSESSVSRLCQDTDLKKIGGRYIIYESDLPKLKAAQGQVGNHSGLPRR